VVLEAVAVALEGEDLGVVDEPVDHCCGGGVVAEDLAPCAEGLVAGDDQACALVAAADEHEHEVRGLRVEWDVADLVADQERVALEAAQLVLEAALALRVGEQSDPLGGGAEQHTLPGEARADREGESPTLPQATGASVDVRYEFGPVKDYERALDALQFKPDPGEDGWRWQGSIGSTPVRIEFLCDLDEYREGESIRPSGSLRLGAANLRGTGYVAHDFEWEHITGALADPTEVQVSVRFAGLQGYLLSKCVALRSRAATKDYYDLIYVLLHNHAGGPEEAAHALRDGELTSALGPLQSTFLEVRERYRDTSDIGPRAYAEQAIQVDPQANEAELRADAVDAVQRLFTSLGLPRAP
jgi:hypothetical protein